MPNPAFDLAAIGCFAICVAPLEFLRHRDHAIAARGARFFTWCAMVMFGLAAIWWIAGFADDAPMLRFLVLAIGSICWLTAAFNSAMRSAPVRTRVVIDREVPQQRRESAPS